jgi:ribosomal protein S6--L-glutamate ligase
MIIRGATQLLQLYSQLGPGDVFIGRIPTGNLKHTLLIDLLERGVHCLPAPLAQTLNGSKVAQAMLLAQWMLPLTHVIRRRVDLFEAMGPYQRKGVGVVITKEDRMHCGHGVRRWENVEALYNMVAFNKSSYPFVLQPYQQRFADMRFIVVGTYVEAYARQNNDNFRMNLAVGGTCRPHIPDNDQLQFCRDVIGRARFPYAHIDLLVREDGRCFLSEIALDGGIKGAKVERRELENMKRTLLEDKAQRLNGRG